MDSRYEEVTIGIRSLYSYYMSWGRNNYLTLKYRSGWFSGAGEEAAKFL